MAPGWSPAGLYSDFILNPADIDISEYEYYTLFLQKKKPGC
jgi:hypothetical protein